MSYIICDVVGYRIHAYGFNKNDSRSHQTAPLFTSIKIAAGNGNAIGLPILVMQILCQDNLINADFGHDSALCYNEASSMIFVYMITWFVMFWGYAFPTLQQLKHKESTSPVNVISAPSSTNKPMLMIDQFSHFVGRIPQFFENPQLKHHLWLTFKKVVINPPILAVMVALFVGLIPAIQQQIFRTSGNLAIVGSAIGTIGEPVVALNTLIMSASLAQCDFPIDRIKRWFDNFLFSDTDRYDTLSSKTFNDTTQLKQNVVDNDQGLEMEIFLEEDEKTIDIEKTIDSPDENDTGLPPVRLTPPLQSILALVVCRLILPPIMMLMINPLFMQLGMIDKSQRLMLLIIMLESCSPPAQVLIVALNQLGIASAASDLSYIYVFMYVTSIFTVTLWTTVAMSVYY